ncbi:cell division protein FtsK [Kineosporia sp. A_224]|uniref:cell division protein FtsK n=1 Tax=Kineosporia sp. A_224 TaxID=1962180 RepID=UPI000B4BE949|nr:cell division protein FtsK [Kineosporia sp. A_224]
MTSNPDRRILRSVPDPDDLPELDEIPDVITDPTAPPTAGQGRASLAAGADEPDGWAIDLPDSDDETDLRLDVESGVIVPVDAVEVPTVPGRRGVERRTVTGWLVDVQQADVRPVLPAWVVDNGQRREAARFLARYTWHKARFHAVRFPVYGVRVMARTPRGAGRAVASTWRWVFDAEARPLRHDAVNRNDPKAYLALVRERNARVRVRGVVATVLAVLVVAGGVAVRYAAPWWVQAVTVAVAMVVLAVIGTSHDRPLTDAAAIVPRARRLTAGVVERAFMAAKLASEKDPITFPLPIVRDGAGWRAVLDLPYSTTADQAIRKRDAIAAGLDLDESMVWPERVRGTTGSARRLALWVADEDPFGKPSGTWPLAQRGAVDLFAPFPFGQDPRGRVTSMQLMFTSLVVGAIPRMGKTFAARLPILAAALDPTAELHVYDGKGGQDWRAFEAVAHRIGFGARDDTVTALLDDLRALRADMDRRYDALAALPPNAVPDSKVTREVANRRGLGLHPVVVAIDEFQRFSEHASMGAEIVEHLIDLAKVGPAVGIIVVLATQKPDAVAIPTRLRDVIGTRFALKCMTWQTSDNVLGAGAYSAGYDASRFQRGHKGTGWLLGADDSGAVEEAVTVRTFLADGPAVARVIERARALREGAGLLTGMATGEMPAPPVDRDQVLIDVLGVWPLDEDRLWSSEIVDRLALAHSAYDGWTPDNLAAALKPFGITTRQMQKTIDGERTNRRGITRAAVLDALGDRTELPAPTERRALDDAPDTGDES